MEDVDNEAMISSSYCFGIISLSGRNNVAALNIKQQI